MNITFRLRYQTRFGQSLFLCGDHPALGAGRPENALPLQFADNEFWEVTLDLPNGDPPNKPFSYFYLLREQDGPATEDFGGDRALDLAALPDGAIVIIDTWNDQGDPANVYSTEPFRKVLLRRDVVKGGVPAPIGTHLFSVKAPLLPEGQTLCLTGSAGVLGDWDEDAAVPLRRDSERGCFTVKVDLSNEELPVEYKYGVYDAEKKAFVRFEEGVNRVLTEAAAEGGRVIVNDGFARLAFAPWRGAGVAIPVFSLRTEKGMGLGEFLDLPALADWADRAGLKLIQILPVNDTSATHSWTDSYPYAAISAFALHPLYLNLDRLAGSADPTLAERLAAERQRLNALPSIDYEAVMKAKLGFAREIFQAQRQHALVGAEYQRFFAQNREWLLPYAAFCFLRDKFGSADSSKWPEHRAFDAEKIEALAAREPAAREEMDFQCFLQFHLHLQLREAADAVHARGLILKGDIAIGVHRHGADIWQHPELFHADMQAGAPPDAFAAKGQNWGLPTYNWPRMKQDGFAWWKQRFAQMSRYFDAFRIDHILGFFRIWSIPRDAVEGILGYFVPALPLQIDELSERGIPFDKDRFTRPFINDAILREVFGDRAEEARGRFFASSHDGTLSLKPQFATQRLVEKHFAGTKKNPDEDRLKLGLFDVISNVLLIEPLDGVPGEYHFRFGMEQTSSFRNMDWKTQGALRELYLDYFYRRQDQHWRLEAMEKLPALKRVTRMLICGEDLGMVPSCVPEVMKRLGLLSLEIQRMPKALHTEFSRPADAPYLSVVTPSTHDMSTLRGWWREDARVTQSFFNRELGQPGAAPPECETWISREIVRQHLESPALWSIFQLQDLLGVDESLRRPDIDSERINIPAIPNYYWRYRMHVTLEELERAGSFTASVNEMVRRSGR